MNTIYPETIIEKLKKNFSLYYLFLGEDDFFLQKHQDIIFKFAYQRGFMQKTFINIEKNTDWEKTIHFFKQKKLFDQKKILVINCIMKNTPLSLIKNINKISVFFCQEILIILKLNKLSSTFLEKKNFDKLIVKGIMVYSFPLNTKQFINWVNKEIIEKKINIEKNAFLLICKNYEGNPLFLYQLLDIILLTFPNEYITTEKIKKIINNFCIISPLHWINKIFNQESKNALEILNSFYKQQYNSLILIRIIQKNLLQLIYMKREKKLDIDIFFKKNYILGIRKKYFTNAYQNIHINKCIKALKILVQIEIKIKKKRDHDIWINLKTLVLILSA